MSKQLDEAAFALFADQAQTWDLVEAAARLEWDRDPELRAFWRRQVGIVLEHLPKRNEIEEALAATVVLAASDLVRARQEIERLLGPCERCGHPAHGDPTQPGPADPTVPERNQQP